MNTNTVQITLQFKEDGTIAVVDQAKGKIDQLDKSVKDSSGGLSGMSEAWIGLTAKVAAASAVIYGVTRAISSFVSEAAEAEEIEHRLGYAVETAGHSYGYFKTQIDQWAESLMKATRFSDEEARQALTDMFLYTTNLAKAQQGASLAMDMATRKGMDLSSATRFVGMAMTGNIEILGRMLPEFRNLNDTLGQNVSMDEKAAFAMKILNEKFGGTAQKDVETYSGKVKQFSNSWKELKESIGADALPALSSVFDWLKKIVDKMRELKEEGGGRILGAPFGKPTDLAGKYLFPKTKAMFGVEEGLPEPGKEETLDPYVKKYGLTETELQDRLSRSKLSYQGWLEERVLEGQTAVALLQGDLDKLAATWAGTEFTYPTEDILPDLMQITNQYGEILTVNKTYYNDIRDEKLAMAELLATVRMLKDATGAEFTYPTEDILPEWMQDKNGKPVLVERWKNMATESQTVVEDFAKGISGVWSSSFSEMRRSGEDFSEWFKKSWLDMADYVIGQIQKILINEALFGNMTGKSGGASLFGTSSGGYGGLIGGILSLVGLQEGGYLPGGFRAFQGGGYVNRPTLGMIGEGGEGEYIIPESKMGRRPEDRGGDTTIINMYVEATDVDSFERKYGGSVTKIIHRNKKSGGMRS